MAVAYDAFTGHFRTDTSDPTTFTHTPSGTPRGVAVFIGQLISTADLVTGVTYGGVPLEGPVARGVDTSGELGTGEWWYLGEDIPTGAQTVSVDLESAPTEDIYVACVTITAGRNTEVIAANSIDENVLDPQVTLPYGGRTALALAGIFSGHAFDTSLAELGTMTRLGSQWSGTARGFVVARQTTPGSSNFTIGWTAANEDVGLAAIAISEIEEQIILPNADITDGNWLNESGTATNLFASIDDGETPNDSDYIESPTAPVDEATEIALGDTATPDTGTVSVVIRHRTV